MVWEHYVVTKSCKDPQAVARLLDIVYSEKYAQLTAFGQEGLNFYYDKDGVLTSYALPLEHPERKAHCRGRHAVETVCCPACRTWICASR